MNSIWRSRSVWLRRARLMKMSPMPLRSRAPCSSATSTVTCWIELKASASWPISSFEWMSIGVSVSLSEPLGLVGVPQPLDQGRQLVGRERVGGAGQLLQRHGHGPGHVEGDDQGDDDGADGDRRSTARAVCWASLRTCLASSSTEVMIESSVAFSESSWSRAAATTSGGVELGCTAPVGRVDRDAGRPAARSRRAGRHGVGGVEAWPSRRCRCR